MFKNVMFFLLLTMVGFVTCKSVSVLPSEDKKEGIEPKPLSNEPNNNCTCDASICPPCVHSNSTKDTQDHHGPEVLHSEVNKEVINPKLSSYSPIDTCTCDGKSCSCCVHFAEHLEPGCVNFGFDSCEDRLLIKVYHGNDTNSAKAKVIKEIRRFLCVEATQAQARVCGEFKNLELTEDGPKGCVGLTLYFDSKKQKNYNAGCFGSESGILAMKDNNTITEIIIEETDDPKSLLEQLINVGERILGLQSFDVIDKYEPIIRKNTTECQIHD